MKKLFAMTLLCGALATFAQTNQDRAGVYTAQISFGPGAEVINLTNYRTNETYFNEAVGALWSFKGEFLEYGTEEWNDGAIFKLNAQTNFNAMFAASSRESFNGVEEESNFSTPLGGEFSGLAAYEMGNGEETFAFTVGGGAKLEGFYDLTQNQDFVSKFTGYISPMTGFSISGNTKNNFVGLVVMSGVGYGGVTTQFQSEYGVNSTDGVTIPVQSFLVIAPKKDKSRVFIIEYEGVFNPAANNGDGEDLTIKEPSALHELNVSYKFGEGNTLTGTGQMVQVGNVNYYQLGFRVLKAFGY